MQVNTIGRSHRRRLIVCLGDFAKINYPALAATSKVAIDKAQAATGKIAADKAVATKIVADKIVANKAAAEKNGRRQDCR